MTSRRVRILVAALVVCGILVLQAFLFSRRIPTLDAEQFDARAVELRRDADWRYGYTSTIHGAMLVRTVNAGGESRTVADDKMTAGMRRELAALPRRALLEALFYSALAVVVLHVVPRAWRDSRRPSDSRARRAMTAGLLAAAVGILIVLPQTLTGYGGSAFSTWVGPYAMSSSGPYTHVTWIPGETVTYRTFLEILLLPGLGLTRLAGAGLVMLLPFLSGDLGDWIARPLYSTCMLAVFFAAGFATAYVVA